MRAILSIAVVATMSACTHGSKQSLAPRTPSSLSEASDAEKQACARRDRAQARFTDPRNLLTQFLIQPGYEPLSKQDPFRPHWKPGWAGGHLDDSTPPQTQCALYHQALSIARERNDIETLVEELNSCQSSTICPSTEQQRANMCRKASFYPETHQPRDVVDKFLALQKYRHLAGQEPYKAFVESSRGQTRLSAKASKADLCPLYRHALQAANEANDFHTLMNVLHFCQSSWVCPAEGDSIAAACRLWPKDRHSWPTAQMALSDLLIRPEFEDLQKREPFRRYWVDGFAGGRIADSTPQTVQCEMYNTAVEEALKRQDMENLLDTLNICNRDSICRR